MIFQLKSVIDGFVQRNWFTPRLMFIIMNLSSGLTSTEHPYVRSRNVPCATMDRLYTNRTRVMLLCSSGETNLV